MTAPLEMQGTRINFVKQKIFRIHELSINWLLGLGYFTEVPYLRCIECTINQLPK